MVRLAGDGLVRGIFTLFFITYYLTILNYYRQLLKGFVVGVWTGFTRDSYDSGTANN